MVPDLVYQPAMRMALKVITACHRVVYAVSGRRVGWWLPGGARTLWLTTTGRRTGQLRTVPLLSIRDGDTYVVTGSNGGQRRSPGWVANLRAQPLATIRVRNAELRVRADEVRDTVERELLYKSLTRAWHGYASYPRRAGDRQIPVFRLVPVDDQPGG
jgi:deazaflavin-dependent oxidoreductase (nitroreductase family)